MTVPRLGAVSAAHPLAVEAGFAALEAGGNAVDAATAAQAVIAVVMPQAAGLGGDLLELVREPDGTVLALGGTGLSARRMSRPPGSSAGSSVTVPGMVAGWQAAQERWGRLSLAEVLRPAIRIAREGLVVDERLAGAARTHADRIRRNGGEGYALLGLPVGALWVQPELAALLEAIAERGASAFYRDAAAPIVTAVRAAGGELAEDDLADHEVVIGPPVTVAWDGGVLAVQPPSSQGVLLALAASWFERRGELPPDRLDHLLVEATEAAFAFREECARGEELLEQTLEIDEDRASGRGGPRAYLHTAGIAVADADGMVVSSLISVFDLFGSGVFVPELGIVLNNRAEGFTTGANAPRPAARPVHTLAPALLDHPERGALALATPGADGQVQTLLQVLGRMRYAAQDLRAALAAPRWRSEDGALLIEPGHPSAGDLAERGHGLVEREAHDPVFGGVVAAGFGPAGPYAEADPRRRIAKDAR